MHSFTSVGRPDTSRRTLLCAALAALTAAGGAFSPRAAGAAPWPSDPSALARAVASAYENEERGVVAFDVTQSTEIRGTLFHRDDLDVTAFVEADGKLVHKAVLRHVEGGKSDDRAGLAKREAEPQSPLGRFAMRLPCDPAAQADYSFEEPQDEGVVLAFRARVRDQAHGDGRIVLDPGGTRIARIEFKPAVLPDRASAANVTIAFGPLGAGRYGIARIVRTFEGHVGPLRGRATSTAVYGNVRAFASAGAATEAVEHER
ncbi:MAG: hypothetical protein QOI11_3081 [Candidatus Eremiobacteraeota bacterium]|nr:hypothetical protein [Candidatus Eremiobacteraeota bacterium]